jgi:hypothetical protein
MNPSQLNPDLTAGGALDNGVPKKPKNFENEDPNDSGDDSEGEKPARRSGRRKIKIEYIEDKNRRHITFSKRKAGIMKKVMLSFVIVCFFSLALYYAQKCSFYLPSFIRKSK